MRAIEVILNMITMGMWAFGARFNEVAYDHARKFHKFVALSSFG